MRMILRSVGSFTDFDAQLDAWSLVSSIQDSNIKMRNIDGSCESEMKMKRIRSMCRFSDFDAQLDAWSLVSSIQDSIIQMRNTDGS